MLQDINVISLLGLSLALPALYFTFRLLFLLLRLLLSILFSKEKVTITYQDKNGKTYKQKIYLEKDDELIKILDDIAEKNSHKRESHG
ncbi:hypothetical protein PSI23_21010 [Xenorhabdus sp. XENO-10]|uniref:Uncharacterized protein n=1 Tax=Xenorhabdus yunnanensis TaxID=3025878 RepID=A0ABT5LPL0_9GAMM|nr:hypothetical protein [Xenorhabdus yunnanensis]MDC9591690.1 hypothetical protein [Xenorhabdus yunnanensis]